MQTIVHQLLHGYRRGHELLAGSTKPSAKDAELIHRLSDLSGTLVADISFRPYLTAFPLPSGSFYVLSKTWLDEEAPRAGCVVTHSLLIQMDFWRETESPHFFESLLRVPTLRNDLNSFEHPIVINQAYGGRPLRLPTVLPSEEFINRYFGEGIAPVVWLDEPFPEDAMWLLVRRLWPALRSCFSCCTYCLQPRNLELRPFDLMFAPGETYRRFHRLPRENIIGASNSDNTRLKKPFEDWVQIWARCVFSEYETAGLLEDLLDEYTPLLSSDPTDVGKIFLIRDLHERLAESPTAAIGLLDVVASLAPSEGAAVSLKNKVITEALNSIEQSASFTASANAYLMLSDRLSREPFAAVGDFVSKHVASRVAQGVLLNPEVVLRLGEPLITSGADAKSSAYVRGVVEGLTVLANQNTAALRPLHSLPTVARALISYNPIFVLNYLESLRTTSEFHGAIRDIVEWLSSLSSEVRSKLRREMVLKLVTEDDSPLLDEILRDTCEDDLPELLPRLSVSNPKVPKAIRQVLAERISRPFPHAVRQWASSSSFIGEFSFLIAETYPKNGEGLRVLLEEPYAPGEKHREIVASFFEGLGLERLPYWLRDLLAKDVSPLYPLLTTGAATSSGVSRVLEAVLSQVHDLPLALVPDLESVVCDMKDQPFIRNLEDRAMRSSLRGFVEGKVSAEKLGKLQGSEFGSRWLRSAPLWDVKSIVGYRLFNHPEARDRAWRWLAEAPKELCGDNTASFVSLVEALGSYSWSEGVVASWKKLLERASKDFPQEIHLALAARAVRYAFDHLQAPVSCLVVCAFPVVYESLTGAREASTSTFAVFNFFDWDKGKELRKQLIQSFVSSDWPPGDLAITAVQSRLLGKVVKRLSRKAKGEAYVEAMARDLSGTKTKGAVFARTELVRMMRNPDFKEDWD